MTYVNNTIFETWTVVYLCNKNQQNAHFFCQAHPAIYQTAYMDAWKKYHKTPRTSLPEDEHLDVRNMSKIKLKH